MLDRDVWKRVALTGLLVGVTAIWGWTFVVVQDAVAAYGLLAFLALRFGIATATMAPLSLRRMNRGTLRTGLAIGAVLGTAYLLQTLGLQRTTPTNCGLVTGLFILFVPIFDRLLYGIRLRRMVWVAILASVGGLALLMCQSPPELRTGDLLTAGGAAAYGLHMSLLSRHSSGHHSGALTMAQMMAVALAMGAACPAFERLAWPTASVWAALGITGVLASALAFYVQTYVQARLSAVRTGIIITMEPLFAAAFGYALAGDRLTALQIVGAVVMIGAMMMGQLLPAVGNAGGGGGEQAQGVAQSEQGCPPRSAERQAGAGPGGGPQ
jgi:drug/metabolite transporter (DMT)-like permease